MSSSIRARLALVMTLLMLLPVLGLGAINIRHLRTGVRSRVERDLVALTRDAAQRTSEDLQGRVRDIDAMARQRVVEQGLLLGEDADGSLALFLDRLVGDGTDGWTGITVMDPSGHAVARSRELAETVHAARAASVSVIRGQDGDWLLRFVAPVHPSFDRAATIGVVVAYAKLGAVLSPVRSTLVAAGHDLALIDATHTLFAPGLSTRDAPATRDRLARLSPDESTWLSGRPVVGWVRTLITQDPSLRLEVVVFTDANRAFAAVRALTVEAVVLVLGVALLGIPLCVLVALWFARPIVHLSAAVARSSDAIVVEGHDEIADLARAINRYREDVAHRAETNTALSRELQRSQFINMMSHELRTPLASIIAMNELALEDGGASLAPDVRESLELVGQSAQALLQIVNNILEMSRLRSGRLTAARVRMDVEEMVEDCLGVVKVLVRDRGVKLTSHVAPDAGMMEGDPGKLRQILINLLGNAAKFTTEGEIGVDVRREGDSMRFDIRDTGPGISPENQKRVFEAFEQVENQNDRGHGGTGLGLAICVELARVMGGALSLESEPGRGSTFTVIVPAGAPIRISTSRRAALMAAPGTAA